MGKLSLYGKTPIINVKNFKHGIKRQLCGEDRIKVSRHAIAKYLDQYAKTGLLTNVHRGGKDSILTGSILILLTKTLSRIMNLLHWK